jgi:hypothetical protein
MKPAASVAAVCSTTIVRVPGDGNAPPSVEPSANPYGLCTPRRWAARGAVVSSGLLGRSSNRFPEEGIS